MKSADSKYLSDVYIPYDYWYTVYIERDHHVDLDHVPEKVAQMIDYCYPDQPELEKHSDDPDQNMKMR
ncbi:MULTISPECIES: hypothetical protein [unclassified Dehalobacter]|uniref:hypothetical protein n=1 Tax=unclassified Dehalobacter TaxID=2635733 RepID=UPI001FAAF552|nr:MULTISPECIES: hypothetical protein [unclassified Dehalobacter]